MNICTKLDDYMENRWYWEVTLDNGQKIVQDDDRPGLVVPQAWLRLKEYYGTFNLDIVEYWLKFRDHHICIYNNAFPVDGFYFANGIGKDIMFDDAGIKTAILGYILNNDQLITYTYMVPELEPVESQHRQVEPYLDRFIIWNGGYGKTTKREKQLSV